MYRLSLHIRSVGMAAALQLTQRLQGLLSGSAHAPVISPEPN